MPWSIEPAKRLLTNHAESWQTINRTQYGDHPLLDIRFTGPLLKYFGSNHVYLALQRLQDEPIGMALVESEARAYGSPFKVMPN